MASLWAASAFFVAIHLGLSGSGLRDRVVAKVGEGPYMGLFSLASLGGLVWMIQAYGAAQRSVLWSPPQLLFVVTPVLMAVAVWFIVMGLTTPSPTLTAMDGLLAQEDAAKGVLRITRHPMLMGLTLLSGWHLAINGDTGSILFFFNLAVVSVAGAPSIDRKRRRKHGEAWDRFAAQTSIVPFLAIVQGRTRLRGAEIPPWQWGLAAGVYGLLLWAHPLLFGVSAVR